MIPTITTTNGQPLIYIPLSVVVAVSAIKDLFEDLARRKDDSKENHGHTLKLTADGFVQCQWQDVRVGDIIKVFFEKMGINGIKVEEGEYIPADMVILQTSEKNGNFRGKFINEKIRGLLC